MRALNSLGNIASDRGNFDEADTSYGRAASIAVRIDDPEYLGRTLNNRGTVAQSRGDLDAAAHLYREALDAARRSDNLADQCYALINLGEVAVGLNHLEEAEALLAKGLTLAHECGDRLAEATVLNTSGWVALRRTEPREALDRSSRAAHMFHELGDNIDILIALGRLALASHQVGDFDHAILLLSAERALRVGFAYGPSPHHDELVAVEAELRFSLGRSFEEIEERAESMTLEQVMQHIRPTGLE